ncbi:MAG: hypothetical protein VKJ24_21705 [Synechococcales bacterium]|nr:hypothetical protein [Synechococcales bacterium]
MLDLATRLLGRLSPLAILMWSVQPTIAAFPIAASPIGPQMGTPVDTPICYAQFADQRLLNLNALCGVNEQLQPNPTYHPRLAELQRLKERMAQAKNAKELNDLVQQFESRLPYSDRVRQLKTQQRDLLSQLGNSQTPTQKREVIQKMRNIQQEIYRDPSYIRIQQEIHQMDR